MHHKLRSLSMVLILVTTLSRARWRKITAVTRGIRHSARDVPLDGLIVAG
jgi:hypothetical protein